jgi:hypothetical protein
MSDIDHPKKKKKHPKDMTTEEAMKHLFTHKGRKLIRKRIANAEWRSVVKYIIIWKVIQHGRT